MADGGLTKIRLWTGMVLAIVSFAMQFVVIYLLLTSMLIGTDYIPKAVLIITIASFIFLIVSPFLLKIKFIYWFVPSQAFAFAAIITGIQTIFIDGLMGIASLVFGLTISFSANRLLARYSPRIA